MAVIVAVKIKYSRSSSWQAVNPLLPEDEIGIERDTGRSKRGDGLRNWNDLPYTRYRVLQNVPIDVEVETSNDIPVEVFRFKIPSGRTAKIIYDCLAAGRNFSAFGGFRTVIYQAINDLLLLLSEDGDEGNNGPTDFIRTVEGNDVVFSIKGVNGERINWLLSFEVRFVDIPAIASGGSGSGSASMGSGSSGSESSGSSSGGEEPGGGEESPGGED